MLTQAHSKQEIMMRNINRWFVLVVVVVGSAGVFAQGNGGGKNPPSTANPLVRASFVYCGGDENCESSNRVRQDTNAEYVHGVDGVKAEFNLVSGSRDLTIGLITSQRSLTFDFSVLVNAGTVMPAWLSSPVRSVKPYFGVLGAYYAKENCPVESSECNYQARMNAGNWKVAGDNSTYALFWNPIAIGRPVNSPDTTSYVNVRYIRNDGTSEVFIITPILTTDADYALAGMEQANRKVVKGAGQYHMPFTLTVRPK